MSLRGAKVLVLGAGGAARAAVFGLRDRALRSSSSTHAGDRAEARRQAGSKTIKKDALAKTPST
jgi:3-dehydroquinate dehydratase/shikimate dehydrogenase